MKKRFLIYLLLVIILSTYSTALIIGGYGHYRLKHILEDQKNDLYAAINSKFVEFDRVLYLIEMQMREHAQQAILDVSRDLVADGGGLRTDLSRNRLEELAAAHRVSEIYLISREGIVFTSSFAEDIGLNLSLISPDFKKFLDSVYGRGKVMSIRVSVSVKTGKLNLYTYYSPVGANYIIETSIGVKDYVETRYSQDYYSYIFHDFFMDLKKANRYINDIDIYISGENPGTSWSLIHEGKHFDRDVDFILRIIDEGEIQVGYGDSFTIYTYFKPHNMNFEFTNRFFVKLEYDFSLLYKHKHTIILYSNLLCGMIILVVFALSSLLFNRYIIARVARINQGLNDIAEGRYQAEIQIGGSDDLTRIARNILAMKQRIMEREAALKDNQDKISLYAADLEAARNRLEVRVEERTAELVAANTKLHEEIRERMEVEAALAEEKELLSVTLGSIADGVITCDRSGRVALMNSRAESMTGRTGENAVGQPMADVFRILDQNNAQGQVDPVRSVLQTGEILTSVNPVTIVDGKDRPAIVDYSVAPIRDRQGVIIGAALVFRDMTEKRRLEETLLIAKKLESVSLLAGGIAHDFNNLLTVILGNINLVQMGLPPDDPKQERLQAAENASLRARDLTHRFITFSSEGVPSRKAVSVQDLVMDAVSLALSGSSVECRYDFSGDLKPVEIDQDQMNQALTNVFVNAREAMPRGGVLEVCAENVFLGEERAAKEVPVVEGDYVRLCIRDHGVGIPSRNLDNVFDPYFSTKERGTSKGMGMGLTTTYTVVRRHGGHISVQSEEGVGTSVCIHLPTAVSGRTVRPGGNGGGEGRRRRILVMDDEEMLRSFARSMLEFMGYEVEVAGHGDEAIQLYSETMGSERAFDLVILDLTVKGGIGGREVMKALLELDPQVKAVVSSGHSADPTMSDYSSHGFSGALPKPYAVEQLREMLDMLGIG